LKPKKEIETNKLEVITKKPIKNKIRKKDKIIFHDGEGEFPFGFALSGMPKGYGGIYKAEEMFDKKGSLTGVSINLEFTVGPREYDDSDVPKNVIGICNDGQERDEFFTIHLSKSVISKFKILGDSFTLVKCRINKSIVKIYLSKPIDIAKKPPAGTVSFFHDVILFSDDLYKKILESVETMSANSEA